MPERPLQIHLEATDHRPDQFTLTFNSSHYFITLNPETNVTFSGWLRRLHPVLAGQKRSFWTTLPTGTLTERGDLALAGSASRGGTDART